MKQLEILVYSYIYVVLLGIVISNNSFGLSIIVASMKKADYLCRPSNMLEVSAFDLRDDPMPIPCLQFNLRTGNNAFCLEVVP